MSVRGKHRKLKIALAITAAAAAVVGLTFWKDVPPGSLLDRWFRPAVEADMGPVTAMVVRQDVEEIYQTNGSIISNESLVVNAESSEGGSTSGYVVDKVNVAVGDEVQAGDVLFTLDMTATENEIALKEKQLALQQSSNAIDAETQQRALEAQQRALETQQRQLDNQSAEAAAQAESDTRKLQQSADDVNFAIADNIEAAARVRTLVQQEENAKAAYESAQAEYDSRQQSVEEQQDKANDVAIELAGKTAEDEGYADLLQRQAEVNARLSEAQTDLSRAETTLSEKKSAYSDATAARESAEDALSEKDQQILSNYRALLDQGDSVASDVRKQTEDIAAQQDALADQQDKIADQQDALAKQNISNQSSTIEAEEAIRTANEKLAMNTVTAPISGTVTTVNVLDGQIYNGTRAVVIQNLDSMKATAEIPEGQIADLPVGTKVRLTTDATGDETLNGEISFVSPVPTSQQGDSTSDSSVSSGSSSSGSKPKYQVNVAITDDTSRLFIGMTARLQFILKSNKDTLAVPTSCIQDDGMGNQYVTVVQGDGSDLTNTVDVMIETGAADDSMTAVTSGNLQEGDLLIDYGASTDDGAGDLSMDGVY